MQLNKYYYYYYTRKELQEGDAADDVAYRLRSRLVNRSGATKDKPTQTGNSLGQEQITENTHEKEVPGKVKTHPYNLRSNVEFACTEMQE